jgi:hypothetical protein
VRGKSATRSDKLVRCSMYRRDVQLHGDKCDKCVGPSLDQSFVFFGLGAICVNTYLKYRRKLSLYNLILPMRRTNDVFLLYEPHCNTATTLCNVTPITTLQGCTAPVVGAYHCKCATTQILQIILPDGAWIFASDKNTGKP